MKPLDDFNRYKSSKDGRQAYCRECQRIKGAEWYDANREKAVADSRAWNLAHPERAREAVRRYQAKESSKELQRWRYANTAYGDRARARGKVYREQNREQVTARVAAWRAANPERTNRNKRNWAAAHPEYTREFARLKSARRRAMKRETTTSRFTVQQLASRLEYYGGRCWMCGAPWAQWDHVKPLSRGGAHMLANLRPACSSCNISKGAQWPVDTTVRKAN